MSISVVDVAKRFKDFHALNGVSLDIEDGSLTSILGPSGSGKSTLLRVIAGLERPDSGKVYIFGQDMTNLSPQKRGVGFVFQHYAAFKHMTVRDNVAFGLTVRRRPKKKVAARVDELLELVQLQGFAERYPSQLSGGQRQRMGLARALAVEPKVMLLDEPFGALDARVRQELRAWLRRLHDEVHVTTILVTHDQEEAMEISDHVVVMNHGRIEQVGDPKLLYDHPSSEFVMAFVGQANRIGDRLVRPHEVVIRLEPGPGLVEAIVQRIMYLGYEVRGELSIGDDRIRVQLSRAEAEKLALKSGQGVFLSLDSARFFQTPDLAAQA
jgi:sulfate transport system ATP-binding protein